MLKVMKDVGVDKIEAKMAAKVTAEQAEQKHQALMEEYGRKSEQYEMLMQKTNRLGNK